MKQKQDKFRCRRCGYCCMQIVVLSKKEIDAIKKLGHKEEDFLETDALGRKTIKMKNYYCHFLSLDKGMTSCRIYDSRPETCRKYPFFKGCTAECSPARLTDNSLF